MDAPIRKAWWQAFRVPFRRPFANSQGVTTFRDGLLVAVESSSGTGVGEVSLLESDGLATVTRAAEVVRSLAGRISGLGAREAWRLIQAERPAGHSAARASICGVETALVDLMARDARVRAVDWLAEVNGLSRRAAEICVPVNGVVQADEPAAAVRAAVELCERGMTSVKLKAGGPAADAVRLVGQVRGAVGDGIELRADANGVWTFDDALAFLTGCEAHGLALCEEPLRREGTGWEQLARLRRCSPVRIAVDESCRFVEELEGVIAAAAADVVVIKPMACGLGESVRLLRRSAAAEMPAIVTTTFDLGVGTAMAATVAALREGGRPACGLATLDFLEDDLVLDFPAVVGGALRLPAGPGFGMTPDLAAMERYALPVRGEAGP